MKNKVLLVSVLLNVLLIGYALHHLAGRWLAGARKPEAKEFGWYYKNSDYWHDKTALFRSFANDSNEVLFIGDSMIDNADWFELFNDPACKNRGIDGETTDGLLERLGEITESHPKMVLIEVGTNDLALIRPIQEIVKNYSKILEEIRACSPETKLVVQSVLPRFDRPERKGGVSNDSISSLNIQLKDLAKARNAAFVNLNASFLNAAGQLNSAFSEDGVHLNAKGYGLWKSILQREVAYFFPKSPRTR